MSSYPMLLPLNCVQKNGSNMVLGHNYKQALLYWRMPWSALIVRLNKFKKSARIASLCAALSQSIRLSHKAELMKGWFTLTVPILELGKWNLFNPVFIVQPLSLWAIARAILSSRLTIIIISLNLNKK